MVEGETYRKAQLMVAGVRRLLSARHLEIGEGMGHAHSSGPQLGDKDQTAASIINQLRSPKLNAEEMTGLPEYAARRRCVDGACLYYLSWQP